MHNLIHSWQFYITISVIAFSFATILQKILLQKTKTDGVTYSIFFQLIAGLVIGIFALYHGFHFPNLSHYILNVVLMIIFYGLSNVCIFRSLSLTEASQFTVIFSSRALWTILIVVAFLGEHFSITQLVGALLILGSITVIFLKKRSLMFNKGTLYALAAAILFGCAFANDAYMLRHFDVLSYETISFILPALGLMIMYPKTITKLQELVLPGVLWKLIVFAFLWGGSAVSIFYGYQLGRNAGQLSALENTATILTVLLAIVLLKEKEDIPKKLLATILAFIGVLLVG